MSGGAPPMPPPPPPHHHHFPDLRSIFSSNTALLSAAVVFLVLVLLFVLLLHVYAKCFLLPRIPPPLHSFPAPSGRHPPAVSGDPPPPAKGGGLDSSAIAAIPLFEYGSGTGAAAAAAECVICLTAFRDGDKGRTLPACAHRSFHVDCIDTWLLSRSSCPVCRAPVIANPPAPETDVEDEPPPASGESADSVAIEIDDNGNGARNHDPESAETPPSVASLQQLGCSLRRMMGRNNRSERKIHPSSSSSIVNQIQLGDS